MSELPKDPSEASKDAHPLPTPDAAPSPDAAPLPEVEPVIHTPVQRVDPRKRAPRPAKTVDTRPAEERRDFFSEAMREALIPLSGLLERRINPILAALEAIPDDVERLTNNMPNIMPNIARALDQPQTAPRGPKNWPLGEAAQPEPDPEPVRTLLPPGATPGEFESRCSNCGKCVEVCPANAIRIDANGLVGGGLPHIVAATQPCVVCDTLACMTHCPTGALKLTDRLKIRMGTARVNLDVCLRENGEDCRLCVEACPITGAGAGPAGDAILIHADSGRVRVRRHACVGCGLCESRCPTNPAAITIQPFRLPVDPIIA